MTFDILFPALLIYFLIDKNKSVPSDEQPTLKDTPYICSWLFDCITNDSHVYIQITTEDNALQGYASVRGGQNILLSSKMDKTVNKRIKGVGLVNAGKNPAKIRLYAAKLETGSVQTLAHKEGDTWVLNDPPPDYGQELAKCQRYYHVYETAEARPNKALDCVPTMRTNPKQTTIEINGVTYYVNDANL